MARALICGWWNNRFLHRYVRREALDLALEALERSVRESAEMRRVVDQYRELTRELERRRRE